MPSEPLGSALAALLVVAGVSGCSSGCDSELDLLGQGGPAGAGGSGGGGSTGGLGGWGGEAGSAGLGGAGGGGAAPLPPGAHLWSKRFGNASSQQLSGGVAVDYWGNVILAGACEDMLDFGGGPLACSEFAQMFLVKLGPDGGHLWSRLFGDGWPSAAATGSSGEIVLAGSFEAADFGGGSLPVGDGGWGFFVARLGEDGGHLWSAGFSADDLDDALELSVSAGPAGTTFIAGGFTGTLDLGGGPIESVGKLPHGADLFVAKFGPSGEHIWSRGFGSGGEHVAKDVAADGQGNVIVAGASIGAIDFGGGPCDAAGFRHIFVAKLGPDGEHLWSRCFGEGVYEAARAVAADEAGSVVLAGEFDAVDFGGGMPASADYQDAFVAKLDPDGEHLWSRAFGGPEQQWADAVAIDPFGNVVFSGQFAGDINLGDGVVSSFGGEDLEDPYVAKLDPHGNPLWSHTFVAPGWPSATYVASDAAGSVVLAGDFFGSLDLGGGPLVNVGYNDIFAAKFAP